ncbi:DNA ligase Cdc9, putative [Aspergillus fumigatus A1163]|uniref:DNA ligase n=2 Tax=Aspergillus fumigatus TaxID=746128 RepID=Q4X1R8_ASPFU|nr:DNA ligase Cdc9, putative [Aspergillus fumigatus Af293]EAL93197.1 DNA ligase Cdc9, putative [Aspergillus fumigatus Af293]EDP54434.1 DNA ligase Cdc9, putative [Aspergillus fumigatus A1163]
MTILRISASIAPVSHYCRGPVAFTPKARISHRTSLRTFTGYTRPPFLSGATRSVVSTTHCSFAITTLPTMADSKGRKQATLGRFFGSNAEGPKTAPKKQTTLSFSSKKDKKSDVVDEQAEAREFSGIPEAKSEPANSEDVKMEDLSETEVAHMNGSPGSKSLKREKSSDEESDSDVQPLQKRRRKSSRGAEAAPTIRRESPSPMISEISKAEVKESSPPAILKKASGEETPEKETEHSEEEEVATASEEEDEDEKPEVMKKTMEKVQATLKATGTEPYPDWKPGEPVPYAALCKTFSLIEMTTKRLIILAHCSLFLRQVLRLTPQDLLPTVQLMINKLAADYAGIELGIGESFIMKAIGESTGRSLAVIKADQHEIGDLGLVAAKSRSNQPTMFKPKPLTVRGVHEGLIAIAKIQGQGSQDKKISAIKKLLEAKFIVRFLEGKLRLGLAEKTVLVALAQAVVAHEAAVRGEKTPSPEKMAQGEAVLKTVYSELPAYEVIIPAMLEHGLFNLPKVCKLQPGIPIKPMLAKPTKSITEVLNRFEGKNFTCEYKYDGERAQIHYDSKGLSAIFSRNSEDLSKKYPDVLAKLETWVKDGVKSFVLDCETVAWDTVNKKVLPFQQLMTRKRKDVKAEDVKVKVCIFAFDLLFLNGEPTVKKTLRERRELLHKSFEVVEGEFQFAQHGDTNDLEEIQNLLDESVKASCEGLMVKMLDTEESGYEPSKRSRNWLKVKKDYLAGVGDSLDLVVLGAYYGRGKRTSVYGAFLLAAYNSSTQTYETICNIGTGFSEALLEELYKELSPLTIDRPKPFYSHSNVPKDQPDVWFEPRLVWEVKTADLTLSPRYKAAADEFVGTAGGGKGVSLRFPRFIKSRDDKKPEQATTTRAVAEMYRKQEAVLKENTSKGGVDDDFEY